MELSSLVDMLLSLVIVSVGWWLKEVYAEVKRIQILVNKTREDYATRLDLRDNMDRVMEALHRVEDKLDRALGRE